MIDDKKIEEAAFDYNDGELTSDKLIRAAFIYGAKWAINELLKDLLHPSSEKHKNLKYIVFTTTIFGEVYLFTKQVDNTQDWKTIVECHGIEPWIYRDDIISLIFKEVKE